MLRSGFLLAAVVLAGCTAATSPSEDAAQSAAIVTLWFNETALNAHGQPPIGNGIIVGSTATVSFRAIEGNVTLRAQWEPTSALTESMTWRLHRAEGPPEDRGLVGEWSTVSPFEATLSLPTSRYSLSARSGGSATATSQDFMISVTGLVEDVDS